MKKTVSLLMMFIFVCALSACGKKHTEAQVMAGNVQAPEAITEENIVSSDEDTAIEVSSEEELIPAGIYTAYDRFSGEQLSNVYMEVHSSSNSEITFTYASYSGEVFSSVTVGLDSSYTGYIDLNDRVALNITGINDGNIIADELEAMGAMAFEFIR